VLVSLPRGFNCTFYDIQAYLPVRDENLEWCSRHRTARKREHSLRHSREVDEVQHRHGDKGPKMHCLTGEISGQEWKAVHDSTWIRANTTSVSAYSPHLAPPLQGGLVVVAKEPPEHHQFFAVRVRGRDLGR
jgi:hypothetical protein